MKKKIVTIMLLIMFSTTMLIACDSDDDCGMCNGSGYYDHKTCPACNGSGKSDFDPYEIADDMYGNDDNEDISIGSILVVVAVIALYCASKSEKK